MAHGIKAVKYISNLKELFNNNNNNNLIMYKHVGTQVALQL